MKIGYIILVFMLRRCLEGAAVSTRCPAQWLERPDSDSCYRFWSSGLKTWKNARESCQARDGDLLKLDSKHEKRWIIAMTEKYPADYEWWIGLQRNPENISIWVWTDGTERNESTSFIQWGSGEPNNFRDSEYCAEIWDNLLNDKNCDQPLQYICERPKDLPMKCDLDNGWDDLDSKYCYKFYTDKVPFAEAAHICDTNYARLISINDEDQQQMITDFLAHESNAKVWNGFMFDSSRSIWVNTQKIEANSQWWTDGVPDKERILHNDTSCSVIDTNTPGITNWKPESCIAENSFVCWKEAGTCPSGFIRHKSTCYLLIINDFKTWNEARGFCNLRATKLLEIKDENEWYFVLTLLKEHYSLADIKSVWLGLSGQDLDTLKWDSSDTFGTFENEKSKGKIDQSQNETKCGFIDRNKISSTGDGSSWQFGDCGVSRGSICTIPVNTPVVIPPPEKPRYECPAGYSLHGIKCYHWYADDPVDWFTARETCAQEGADLVTIQSKEEQDILAGLIKSESWIGLNDILKEGTFKWLDSSAQIEWQYWLNSQPNNVEIGGKYSENCVSMLYNPGKENHGKWSDYPCRYKARFVCQIPAEWNIALGKIASQSSLRQIKDYGSFYDNYFYDDDYSSTSNSDDVAHRAIDGCKTRSVQSTSCCARSDTEDEPWWMLDLGTVYPIGKVVIHRRSSETCSDCSSLFEDFRLFISTTRDGATAKTNMVYQEKREHIPALIIIELKNVTSGRYVRIDIPATSVRLELCEVEVFEGKSLRRSLNSGNSNCITDSSKWAGTISHTVSGKTCQKWVLDSPHKHNYHDKKFPDGTEKDADNFCRDPLGEGQPWCYTTDKDTRWEFCPIPHCTTDIDLMSQKDTDVSKVSDCPTGWDEDTSTGYCYWLSDEKLTWSDASTVCESIGASLPLPNSQEKIDLLTGQLSNEPDRLFWLNIFFDVSENVWMSTSDPVPDYIQQKVIRLSKPAHAMCVVSDKSGNLQARSCLERNVYSCIRSGPYMKYQTSSDKYSLQLPETFIKTSTVEPVTHSVKFEYKGYVGATVMLKSKSGGQSNKGYTIRISGNISPKSTISKLGSEETEKFISLPNMCNENEYREFWISWTDVNSNGVTVTLGRGSNVGRNVFLQWTDDAGIGVSTVYIATVTKASGNYQGFWRFREDKKDEKKAQSEVNLALGKNTRQSSSFSDFSTADKAVDGCKENTYNSKCVTHTKHDFEPWWEVDLGRDYPIREVFIYRRGPECCHERLGFFRLLVSMLSDSTLEQDVVYKSEEEIPPTIIHIPLSGVHGRYVKIDIPGRKEYLELAEVEVFEDTDASRCGSGWINYDRERACYQISDVKMTWGVSKEYCEGFNANMVVPKSPREQLFLYELSLPISDDGSTWLGLNDLVNEGTFVTEDGLTVAYTDWGQNEPNNLGSENCVSLRMDLSSYSGKWNDKNCDTPLRAVCRKKETPTTTTTMTTTTTITTTTSTTTTTVAMTTEQVTLPTQGACKPGWLYSPESNSCFMIFESNLNFYSAASKCIEHNARLASIKNRIEQRIFYEVIKRNVVGVGHWDGLWVGGIDEFEEGVWHWFMTNTSWDNNLKWTDGQPDNYKGGEDCVTLRTHPSSVGELNDYICVSPGKGYICQYNLGEEKCSDGWIYNGDTDTCYKYEMQSREAWDDARSKCTENGGILATIASKSEQLFMKVLASADLNIKGAWVGAHDMKEENLFQWIDGTTWISGLWAPNQPNNWQGYQNCAMLTVSALPDALGLIQDDFCKDKYPYICAIRSCKSGWEKFGGNCYLFSSRNLAWTDAKEYCESVDSTFVKVETEKEHNFLRQKVRDSGFEFMWIGAQYDFSVGEHRWTDGSKMTFNGWFPGKPGTAKGCVDYLRKFGYLWNSHWDCSLKGPFICEAVSVSNEGLTEPTTMATSPVSVTSITTQTTKHTTSLLTTTVQPPITTTLSQTTAAGKCGIGWVRNPSSDTCYKFVIELATWSEAKEKCKEDGGNLVSITSEQEQAYIIGRLQGMSIVPEAMWIGANDIDTEAGWKWTDGQPFAYLNWAIGAPSYFENADKNDGSKVAEDCAVIIIGNKDQFGQWDDLPCTKQEGYICRKYADDRNETTRTTESPPYIPETDILEVYQPATYRADFTSVDLFELGVRVLHTFRFSVKTKRDAHVVLQNTRTDFTKDIYKIIIAGWGGGKSVIVRPHEGSTEYLQTGLVSENEYNWFWIKWNTKNVQVGKSEEVGKNVILTFEGDIREINYVSIGTDWSTDAYWRIPKGDKYYGCPGRGWVGYKGSCYLIVEEERDWNGANDYCHKEVAELASIKDENEQSFLFSQLPQGTYCYNKFHNNTMCDRWAEYGECERNPVWMATNCHLSCKHCLHNCRDIYKSSKCLEWSKQGECARNPRWMLINCALTCGVCQGAPTRGYWIGLQSGGMDQSYRWSDHSDVTYTNWNTHQPLWFNLRPRSCVAMFMQNGQWNDGHCSDPLPGFICKQSMMLLSITTSSPFKEGCSMENGYGYGVYCYVYVKEQKTWVDAQKNCVSQGGTLAFVGDAYIQAFVASELQNQLQDYWIGLSVTSGQWTWDGYQIDDIRESLVHLDRSVKADEVTDGCFAMSSRKPIGLWKLHTNCSAELSSVCQVPRPGFTTTTPLTTVTSTEPLPPCEDTWQSYGQYCYKVSDEKQQWHVAHEICKHYGAEMVSINDDDENNAMKGMINENTWLGIHDTENEGVFIWDDGSPVIYTAWNTNEPNNAGNGEDCAVMMSGNGRWNDVSCYFARSYICKIPRGKSVNKEPHGINTFDACDERSPDDGWKAFGNNCYFLGNDEPLTWHEANIICLSKGSNLASVHSDEEKLFIMSLASQATDICWIGFNDLDLDNRYSWSDGSIVDFTSWASGQPNDIYGGEKCVPTYFDGSWHDYPCNDRKPYICMKRKDAATIMTTKPTEVDIKGGCPDGFNHTYGNKCYYFNFDDETFWTDAKDKCEKLGGILPSIHSDNEQNFIALHGYGKSTSVWLGMHDLNSDGRFDWIDNSLLDYSNWAPNEPSSNLYNAFSHEPCVEMWTDADNLGFWNDVKCSARRGYVCSAFKDLSMPIQSMCPDGYIILREKCYKLIITEQSWNQSLQLCSNDGGKMISLVNSLDFRILVMLLGSTNRPEVWIGGISKDNKIQWNDGSSIHVRAMSPIHTGCLYSKGALPLTAECSENRAVICEIDKSLTTTSTSFSTTISTTVTDTLTYKCRDKSWLLYKSNCYATVLDLTSFPNTKCSEFGMILASINSADEEYNITTQILQRYSSENYHGHYPYFWIGLSMLSGDEAENKWEDDSKMVYSNFDTDDNKRRQGCVYMVLYTLQWRIGSCMDKHFYICKGPADIALLPSSTVENTTVGSTQTTTQFKLPPIHHRHKMDRVADDNPGLTGGQIAGIIIGVIGLLLIIGAVAYILKSWKFKKLPYNFEAPSLGFDNALFHKNQDTVDMN